MSWYNSEGRYPHNAVFSVTRYFRNISDIPFPHRAGEKLLEPYLSSIDSLLSKNGFSRESIGENDRAQLLSLAEKGFIDSGFLESDVNNRAIYFNEPCSLAVAVGGRDLISISSLLSGRSLTDTRNIASGAEELLDSSFEFAYNDRSGYLSSSPSLCGSAAELSVTLYLPAIDELDELARLRHLSRGANCTLTRAFTYPDRGGHLYTLSHTPSHHCDEVRVAECFDALVGSMIEEERRLESRLFSEREKDILDGAWRAYGTLIYAKRLKENELLSLSSSIRLALSVSADASSLPPVSITDLNRLLAECLNASVLSSIRGTKAEVDLDESRASIAAGIVTKSTQQCKGKE